MKRISIPGTAFGFNADLDTLHKAAAVVIGAAATAAFTAGEQALVDFLTKDPRYAVIGTVITLLVASFSKKSS